jgi:hypothetical protein
MDRDKRIYKEVNNRSISERLESIHLISSHGNKPLSHVPNPP